MSEDLCAFPTLTTARLRLREIVADDAADLFTVHSDPVLMRWFGSDPLPDMEAAHGRVRRLGFVEEGRLREVGRWGGRHHDMLQFSLLRRDWVAAPPEALAGAARMAEEPPPSLP